jgi:hypothetical protein
MEQLQRSSYLLATSPIVPPLTRRRWLLPLLATVTVLLVVAGLVAEIVLLRNAGRRNEPESNGDRRADAVSSPDSRPLTDAPPSEPDRTPPKDRRTKPVESEKKPARLSESAMTLVGGLTTAHLYQTHLNIGLIADAVAKEVYKVDDGKDMLDTLMRITDTIERQLAQLPESEWQPEEQMYLAKVQRVLSLLRSQVKELKAYWETGEKEYVERFQKVRKDVQKELDMLFGEGE